MNNVFKHARLHKCYHFFLFSKLYIHTNKIITNQKLCLVVVTINKTSYHYKFIALFFDGWFAPTQILITTCFHPIIKFVSLNQIYCVYSFVPNFPFVDLMCRIIEPVLYSVMQSIIIRWNFGQHLFWILKEKYINYFDHQKFTSGIFDVCIYEFFYKFLDERIWLKIYCFRFKGQSLHKIAIVNKKRITC